MTSILFCLFQRKDCIIYLSPFPVMAVQFLFRTSPQIRAPHHAELVEAIYLTSLLSRIIAVFTFVHLRRWHEKERRDGRPGMLCCTWPGHIFLRLCVFEWLKMPPKRPCLPAEPPRWVQLGINKPPEPVALMHVKQIETDFFFLPKSFKCIVSCTQIFVQVSSSSSSSASYGHMQRSPMEAPLLFIDLCPKN